MQFGQPQQLIAEVVVKDSATAVADRVTSALDKMAASEGKLGDATEKRDAKTKVSEATLKSAAAAVENLKRASDPLYDSLTLQANAHAKLQNAVNLGVASHTEMEKIMHNLETRSISVAKSLSEVGTIILGSLGPVGALGQEGTKLAGAFTEIAEKVGITGVAIGLAAGVAAAFALVMKEGITVAEAYDVQQRRLAAVIQATGNVSGLTREEFHKLSEELASKTTFDIPQITQAQAQLLVFRNVQGETFSRALSLSADLAAMMGTDLAEAIQKVGRALENPVAGMNALRRAGIVLSETEKEHIKDMVASGQLEEAQAVILDKLANSVGGVARALNTGLTGALRDAAKAWEEMWVAIGHSDVGHAVLSIILNDLDHIKGIIDFITHALGGSDLAGQIQKLQDQIKAAESGNPLQKWLANPTVTVRGATIPLTLGGGDLEKQKELLQVLINLKAANDALAASEEKAAARNAGGQHTQQLIDQAIALTTHLDGNVKKMKDLTNQETLLQSAADAAQEKIDKGRDPLGKYAAALATIAEGLVDVRKKMKALTEDPDDAIIKGLQDQVDNFNLTGIALAQYTARQKLSKDATDAQKKSSDDLAETLWRLQAAKKGQAEIDAIREKDSEDGGRLSAKEIEAGQKIIDQMDATWKGYDKIVIANKERIASLGESNHALLVEANYQKILDDFRKLGTPLVNDDELARARKMAETMALTTEQFDAQVAAAKEMDRVWKLAADDIQTALVDAFKSAFDASGKNGFNFLATFRTLALKVAAEIAAAMIFKPFIGQIFSAIGAPSEVLKQFGMTAAGGVGQSGGGGVGSGISNFIPNPFSGNSTLNPFSDNFGNFSSLFSGGAMDAGLTGLGSAVGIGGNASIDAAMAAGGFGSEIGAGAGVAMGAGEGAAMAGLSATGYGAIAVAAIMILSQVLGNKHPRNVAGDMAVRQQPWLQDLQGLSGHTLDESLWYGNRGTSNGFPTDTFDPVAQNITKQYQSVMRAIGGTFMGFNGSQSNGDNSFIGRVGFNATTGKYGSQVGDVTNSFDNMDDAVADLITRSIKNINVSGISDDLKAVLKNTTATTVQDLMNDIQFGKNFRDQIDLMNAGVGTAAAQMVGLKASALAAAKQWSDSTNAFLDNTTRLFGTGSEQETTAKSSALAAALAQIGLGPDATGANAPLTGAALALAAINQNIEAFRQTLIDLGMTAEDAGKKIDESKAKAKELLRVQFNTDNQDAITALTYGSGVGQGLALQKAQAQRVADAQTLGGDMASVLTRNRMEADALMDSWSVDQLQKWRDYLKSVNELTDDTATWIQTHIDAAQAAADEAARKTRLVANDNAWANAYTASSNLLISNIQSQIDAQDELGKTMADRANDALSLVNSLTSFGNTINTFLNGLDVGANSTLAPLDKLNAAKSLYYDTLGKANNGDASAQSQLTSTAQAYLDAAKAYSPQSMTAALTDVKSTLRGAASTADQQLQIQKGIYDTNKKQLDKLNEQLAVLQGKGVAGGVSPAKTLSDWANLVGRVTSYESQTPNATAADVERAFGSERDAIIRSATDPGTLLSLLSQYYSAAPDDPGARSIRSRLHDLNIAGFAAGGDFMVGGLGGTDTNIVKFRATRGEMVSVRTPGQVAANANGLTREQGDVIIKLLTRQVGVHVEVAKMTAEGLGAVVNETRNVAQATKHAGVGR